MKTHEIGRLLVTLGKALQKAPNQTLDDLGHGGFYPAKRGKSDVPLALSTLVSLSDFGKTEWEELIMEYAFPIDVRPRDASRDILGKILRYLEQSPEARQRMVKAAQDRSSTSPELMRALQALLKQ